MILYGKSFQSIFAKHRNEFLKCYAADTYKPLTHAELVKRFVDSSGKQYYGFPKDMMFPVERFGQLKMFMSYIAKGLTPEEDEKIDDAISKAHLTEKNPDKLNIRVAGLLAERQRRRTFGFHTELFYNYIAVQLVREDEPVEVFDNDIHKQKVLQFKEEAKKKESTWHFFQLPEFKKLNDMLRLSQDEWNQSYEESMLLQESLSQILNLYTSPSTLKDRKTTSRAK